MKETIGEADMFPDISHDFETVLAYKGLNEAVLVHRCSKYFNALCREHVSCEVVSNICKVRVGVEEMFCTFKQMVCRGTLSENLCLADIKNEVCIIFENRRKNVLFFFPETTEERLSRKNMYHCKRRQTKHM